MVTKKVTKSGGLKRKNLVKCLEMSSLQGLFVPEAGLEPAHL